MESLSARSEAAICLWSKNASLTKKLDLSLGSVHGIGFTEYMVLLHLSAAPGQVLRRIDLANAIDRSASGVTRILKPMEKIGLVSKEANPRDARVSLVKLTPAGKKMFKQASHSFEQQANQALKGIDNKNIKTLMEILVSVGTH